MDLGPESVPKIQLTSKGKHRKHSQRHRNGKNHQKQSQSQNKQMGLHQTNKLYSKGNHIEVKKTTNRIGENLSTLHSR